MAGLFKKRGNILRPIFTKVKISRSLLFMLFLALVMLMVPTVGPLPLLARPDRQIPNWPELPNCDEKKKSSFDKAMGLYHQDEAEKAIELLENALSDGDETAMYGLAYIETQRRNLEEATEYLEILMDETKDKGVLGCCHFLRASIFEEQRMHDKAIEELRLSEKFYKEVDHFEGVVQTHFFLAYLYRKERNYSLQEKHAKIAYRLSIFKKKGRGYACTAMSDLYFRKNDFDTALEYLNKALAGFQQECNKLCVLAAHYDIANLKIYLGRLDGVEEHIEASFPPTAADAKPTLVTAWNHLNYVMLSKCTGNDVSRSHELIRKFLRADTSLKGQYERILKWKCPHNHEKKLTSKQKGK